MSMHFEDFKNPLLLQAALVPSTVTDTNTGNSIDLIDGDGRCFAIQAIGAVSGTSPGIIGKIQESSDGTTWTDIPGASFTSVTAANNLQVLSFERTKRFLRHARTVSGTTPSFAINVLLGQQKKTI